MLSQVVLLLLGVQLVQPFTLVRPLHQGPIVPSLTPKHKETIRRDPSCTVVFGLKSFLKRTVQRRGRNQPGAVDHVAVEERDTSLEFRRNDAEPQQAVVRQPVLVMANGNLTSDSESYYEPPAARQSTMLLDEEEAEGEDLYNSVVATLEAALPNPLDYLLNKEEPLEEEKEEKFCSMATLVALRKISLDSIDQPLYSVTPTNYTLSQLEQEFRNMLESFSNYSQRDIMSLKEENVRILFEGVAACAHETAVYRAFEVLFEDLYPLRVAARVIYDKLRKLMEDSKMQRQTDVDAVVQATGLDAFQVEATWLLFVTTATRINRGAFLTKEQLISTGFLGELKDSLTPSSIEYLIQKMNDAKGNKITFTDFIFALDESVNLECSLERPCEPLVVLGTSLRTIGETSLASSEEIFDEKKQSYGRRYDEMLDAFRHWKGLVPEGTGRRMDVIRGCFVGAENEKVVRALRICYVDYAGLRMAAEIIFKLVKTFMTGREKALQAKGLK